MIHQLLPHLSAVQVVHAMGKCGHCCRRYETAGETSFRLSSNSRLERHPSDSTFSLTDNLQTLSAYFTPQLPPRGEIQTLSVTFTLRTSIKDVRGHSNRMSCNVLFLHFHLIFVPPMHIYEQLIDVRQL